MLTYFLMGATVGVLSGVPIGPVNLAVIDAAYRSSLRRAVIVGLGGAIGDGLYALVGILAMGPILERYPVVSPVLYGVSGLGLFVYSLRVIRAQPSAPVSKPRVMPVKRQESLWSGFLLGLGLILMNPAAIVTWVIIVGLFMQGVTPTYGLIATVGVTIGSLAWFTSVAHITERGKNLVGESTLKITRVVAYLILGYSIFAMGRALHYWLF